MANKVLQNITNKGYYRKYMVTLLSVISILSSSCSEMYKFCQIYETKPYPGNQQVVITNQTAQYEDENCRITYNLWAEGGDASFAFYNKTNEIIHIDMAESFFVFNGIAYDYFRDRAWSTTKTSTTTVSHSYGSLLYQSTTSANTNVYGGIFIHGSAQATPYGGIYSEVNSRSKSQTNTGVKKQSQTSVLSTNMEVTYSNQTSMSWQEQRIISIPPHSAKIIRSFGIISKKMMHCDLEIFPSDSSRVVFDTIDTPIRFSNVVSYKVGQNTVSNIIQNRFYVSSVSNYAMPTITEFIKRDTVCNNMQIYKEIRYDKAKRYNVDVYDKYLVKGICIFPLSFYAEYDIKSFKKLYDKRQLERYQYSSEDGGYVKVSDLRNAGWK